MKTKRVNKILTIIASVVLALCMFGSVVTMGACGGNDNNDNVPAASTDDEESSDAGENSEGEDSKGDTNPNDGGNDKKTGDGGSGVNDDDTKTGEDDDDFDGVKSALTGIEYSYTPEIGSGDTYYVSADVSTGTKNRDGSYKRPYSISDIFPGGSDEESEISSLKSHHSGNKSNKKSGHNGNDESGDLELKAGDTVLLMPGRYDLDATLNVEIYGTYDNYFTVMNAADANDWHTYSSVACTLCFYDMYFGEDDKGVTLNSDYVYWKGIDIAGAGDNGMYIGGSHNVVEDCQFYNNRDTGLELGRADSSYTTIDEWPSYNLIKNCTSFSNYDNETYGENADGFAAKLTVGYGNIFDGCMAYRNSDDGFDIYAKEDTGDIGCISLYNCVAFENGYLMRTQSSFNSLFANYDHSYDESYTGTYTTRDGDGNGFKLGSGSYPGNVKLRNAMTFNNRMHGVTDNSNPGLLQIENVTAYNNCAAIDSGAGYIYYNGGTEDFDCANIDLARWAYSYNALSGVLSVIDGNGKTSADSYRGAVTDCMFVSSSSSGYYIEGSVDADTKNDNGIKGTEYMPDSASETFVSTPGNRLGIAATLSNGIVSRDSSNVHVSKRNNDGTIDFGDTLKVKDSATLEVPGAGAKLDLSSWDEYRHPEYSTGSAAASSEENELVCAANMIYLPVDEKAVFQNFWVMDSVLGYDITWISSDDSVLTVTDSVTESVSGTSTVDIIVNRNPYGDETVTLTAHIESRRLTYDKEFTLTVKKDTPSIGDIIVEGVEDGVLIVDRYSDFSEPVPTVMNAADYNGKILDSGLYSVETKYEYASSAAQTFDEVDGFSTQIAGEYRITYSISIIDPDVNATVTQKSYTYIIFVAATDDVVSFLNGMTITICLEGYKLSGELSNPEGYAYIVKSDSLLTGSGTNGELLPVDIVENPGAVVEEFRSTGISYTYEADNDTGYFVYCVLTSLDGTQFSDVYVVEAKFCEIATTDDFMEMLADNDSSTIFVLKNDLDFTGITYDSAGSVFKGLLNGLGHTVKNITTSGRAVIEAVEDGTIENIKFDNIYIDYSYANSSGTSTTAGIIGLMRGGCLYNIAATNITVISNGQRVGGIVGQINVASGGNESNTYIRLVSLVNEFTHDAGTIGDYGSLYENYSGAIIKGVERVGGIVGFIQAGGTDSWNKVYISDCYVNAYITASSGIAAGIVGRSDDRNANDYLEISGCYVYGVIESTSSGKSYIAGILGQFTGTGKTRIHDCMSYVELWFENVSMSASVKNASWIIGNYASNGDMVVTNCYAKHEEYNSEYDVKLWPDDVYDYVDMSEFIPLDMRYWEFVFDTSSFDNGDGTYSCLLEPFVRLVYQD